MYFIDSSFSGMVADETNGEGRNRHSANLIFREALDPARRSGGRGRRDPSARRAQARRAERPRGARRRRRHAGGERRRPAFLRAPARDRHARDAPTGPPRGVRRRGGVGADAAARASRHAREARDRPDTGPGGPLRPAARLRVAPGRPADRGRAAACGLGHELRVRREAGVALLAAARLRAGGAARAAWGMARVRRALPQRPLVRSAIRPGESQGASSIARNRYWLMRSRAKPSEPFPRLDHAHGDGPLPDLISGLMWTATAVFGLVALALPGTTRVHLAASVAVAGVALAWGGVSFFLGLRGRTMSIHARAGVTAGVMPLVAYALWATGGSGSFIQPVLLLTVLFIAYFFPPRLAAPLSALYVLCYSTPLFYDDRRLDAGYPRRVLMFAIAVTCATGAMAVLKRRLLRAEATQRDLAERDPLTGVHNRRSFDRALAHALYDSQGEDDVALVVFDFNDFKLINDEHGHPVGDAVLSAVADACRDVGRDGDCLARIGGDEFALIAPGAGQEGVRRVVAGLDEVISRAQMPAGVGRVEATFGWAVSPHDAADSGELFRMADERLIERKRGGRRPRGAIQITRAQPVPVS